MYTEEISGGITRFIIGSFTIEEDAVKAEVMIKEMDYEGAFTVICYNGKRVTFKKQVELLLNNFPV